MSLKNVQVQHEQLSVRSIFGGEQKGNFREVKYLHQQYYSVNLDHIGFKYSLDYYLLDIISWTCSNV